MNLILWYLAIALAGWLAFPLAYRLLSFLPDRGYALARPLGLLLWGYIFWLLASLGVLQNDLGGTLLALALLAGLAFWLAKRGGGLRDVRDWMIANRRLVVTSELLFLALFALWAVVRAANPEASGTEKPMELAFINAILRSPAFPPSDPWLSGYSISYYYFGYVMVAVLARVAGAAGGVAFNLALASWFALTGLAAYGLVYNLLALRDRQPGAPRGGGVLAALLGPLFVLIVSNLEGFLEVLHARGVFWQQGADGQLQSRFWQWLNIQELVQPPSEPFGWAPERLTGIWWWRASRVLQDFDLANQPREIIDEFPAFSYLLGDLHPHLLAMPFVLLAIGLALNIYLRLRERAEVKLEVEHWARTPEFWITAIALGGLSFLNTWDFPIYLALFAAAVVLARFHWTGWRWGLLSTLLQVTFGLGIVGIALYYPFYAGFSSQAAGFLPSLVFFTRGVYFWIMFGALLLPILGWLIWLVLRAHRDGRAPAFGAGLLFAAGLLGGLWLLSSLFGWVILQADPGLAGIYGASPGAPLLREAFLRRAASPLTWLSLFALLAVTWALLLRQRCSETGEPAPAEPVVYGDQALTNRADPFLLLLVLLGTGLVLFPEFFYLRDQFGWRMNTIFKFYFQVWMVWALVAAYASAVLWQSARGSWRSLLLQVGWVILLAMALVYPLYGVWWRTSGFSPGTWTLDGTAYLERYSPDEMSAIRWLKSAPYGVVVEAVGGSYSGAARVSTISGLPSVLGWPGHESQWRGGAQEMGTREPDIVQLYKARTWEQAEPILMKYNIRYVYVGSMERGQYRPNDELFMRYLNPVYRNDSVTIYEVPRYNSQQDQAKQP